MATWFTCIVVSLWVAACIGFFYFMMTRPASVGEGLIYIKEEDE